MAFHVYAINSGLFGSWCAFDPIEGPQQKLYFDPTDHMARFEGKSDIPEMIVDAIRRQDPTSIFYMIDEVADPDPPKKGGKRAANAAEAPAETPADAPATEEAPAEVPAEAAAAPSDTKSTKSDDTSDAKAG